MSPKKIKSNFKPSVSRPDDPQKQIQVTGQSHFSGPLPRPDILQKYNDIIPDGAERIMAMAERQSAHRLKTESDLVSAGNRDSFLGIASGLVISIGAFIIAGLGFYWGHPVAAATICTVDLAAIVSIFVYGTKNK